ncbi:SDR family NAD(P)-dependent oxidoreductase [Anaeromicropila herbilytica]|uniref:Short-chain dehydrogenase n=1 Tax=Anaeromicropila herbilytica TaxID=2785025 RepID=A0A7R7IC16_9FIRM|nr:glucose 1-dehydrogenase [Anaeromicropila herbilytica]BCN29376.1 short-chain dehydrogenase [Anaeromicropila herbilytica]
MISFDLKEKVAIVTGASSGLGKQFAKALSEQGASVAILARRLDKLKELANSIEESGGTCFPVECDVTDEDSIRKAVSSIKEKFGQIDILVNNAGVCEFSAGIHDHTTKQWDKVLDTDLKAVFLMTREVSHTMMEQKYGKIINIASVGGIQAGPSQIGYFAAKGGVINLTKAMAAELAPYNVTVNAIGPGVFETEMTDGMLEAEGSLILKNRSAMKRFGKEGELNGALIYFASDACTYTTAQTIFIDGGMTAML